MSHSQIKIMSSNECQTYQMIKLLGEGAYGKAYLVRSNTDRRYCVIKIINIENMTEKEKKDTLTESRILKQLEHQNIIKLKEVFMAKKPQFTLNIVTEYADGGDLAKRINEQNGKFFSESQIINWFTQIALALYHIHSRLIIHRDIKPQNVFLTKKGDVKLGDFGIAKCLEGTWQKAMTCIGTPYYLSPEILMDKPYSFKTDIWSLGVLLYQMTMLKLPFDSKSFHKLSLKILKGKYSPIADCFSVELKELVKSLLQTNPDKRPTIKDVLSKIVFNVII